MKESYAFLVFKQQNTNSDKKLNRKNFRNGSRAQKKEEDYIFPMKPDGPF